MNVASALTGFTLGLNLFNALIIGILGVPGLALLILLKLVFVCIHIILTVRKNSRDSMEWRLFFSEQAAKTKNGRKKTRDKTRKSKQSRELYLLNEFAVDKKKTLCYK